MLSLQASLKMSFLVMSLALMFARAVLQTEGMLNKYFIDNLFHCVLLCCCYWTLEDCPPGMNALTASQSQNVIPRDESSIDVRTRSSPN